MALHPHVKDFYEKWLEKADSYNGGDLSDYFNKAFSLFTLYNKLYAEATFKLARAKKIKLKKNFPDRKGATEYAPQFIGHEKLYQTITTDRECNECLQDLIERISNHDFYIKLGMPYGCRQPKNDKELVAKLNSEDHKEKVEAVLDLIYSVRCNMLHGNKRYVQVQVDLLRPLTIMLRCIIVELYPKLQD